MLENMRLRWQLYIKKLRDMKLKYKIRFFLFGITISTVFAIGIYSLQISRNELMENSRDSVIVLEKQAGRLLDDKINAFKDLSWQLLQSPEVRELLMYTEEEALARKRGRDILPAALSQQSAIYGYIRYALLKPDSGMIYRHYKFGESKLSAVAEEEVMLELEKKVTKAEPTCWTVYDGEVYFVRKILNDEFEDQGILAFAVMDELFQFVDGDINYLEDDNLIVLNQYGEILKQNNKEISEEMIVDLVHYNDKEFYVYYTTIRIDNVPYTTVVLNTPGNGWTIIGCFSQSVLLRGTERIWRAMLEIILLAALLVFGITVLISKTITKNVQIIEAGMKEYEQGHFDYRISPANYDELGELGLQLNYMAIQISQLIEKLKLEEEQKQQFEFETLQAQINPHFLYNILGSLKWTAFRQGQQELAGLIDDLSSLLRFTIKNAGQMVTIREELEYISHYIAIEKMRYGEQFKVVYEIEAEVEEARIPGFVLQPIVENALLHGIDMAEGDGIITIRSWQQEGKIFLQVEDNGIGMSEAQIKVLMQPGKQVYKGFNSIGLNIVDKRLRSIYGEAYQIEIRSEIGAGSSIIIGIPEDGGEEDEV